MVPSFGATRSSASAASVDGAIARFAADGRLHAESLGDDYQALWGALGRVAGSGKRVRSSLLMASYHAYGGRDDEVAATVAAAIELLHTAFVIHDDVIDHDLRRRGEPNVSGAFLQRAELRGLAREEGETLGLAAGVLAGDLALAGAMREIALCGAAPEVTRRLLDQVTEALRISAAGELDDVVMSTGARVGHSLGDVITMEERKTAVYSFQLPLEAGAVLAGESGTDVDVLGTVGRLAGIGFQLVDDLRGVFGHEGVTGKSALGDLREGKVTALITHARGTAAWSDLSRYLGAADLDGEQAALARRLLEECGSRAYVEELAQGYLATALRTAAQTSVRPVLLAELAALCDRILRSAA